MTSLGAGAADGLESTPHGQRTESEEHLCFWRYFSLCFIFDITVNYMFHCIVRNDNPPPVSSRSCLYSLARRLLTTSVESRTAALYRGGWPVDFFKCDSLQITKSLDLHYTGEWSASHLDSLKPLSLPGVGRRPCSGAKVARPSSRGTGTWPVEDE